MRSRKGLLSAVVLATVAIVVSCAETPTGPRPSGEEIVAGKLFHALYIADDVGRVSLAATATMPAALRASASEQQLQASITLGMDSARASAVTRRFSQVARGATLSFDGNRTRVKGKAYTKVVDGRRVDLIVLPDPDRRAKRPARGFVTRIDGRLVSLIEWQYVKGGGGKWRRTGTRLTTVDTLGRIVAIAEGDHSGTVYATAGLRGPGGQMLGAVARLFAPDVLHAEEFTEYEAAYAGCGTEFKLWAAMSSAATGAALAYQAAVHATKAAMIASTAATVASALNPELLPAAEAALAAYLGAQRIEAGALLAWTTATAGAMAAGKELADCMTGKPKPPGSSGPENYCGDGTEAICDWLLYVEYGGNGMVQYLRFNVDSCTCEETWAT